tara:strand:+ start:70 stop:633 length:564 start_codon:yes stop_codon:yes gene_type:complete
MTETQTKRCQWLTDDPLYLAYHDNEWGVPSHDDRHLFECLMLEGMQAGLSWLTILKKRVNYRNAFCNFNVQDIVDTLLNDADELMQNKGIVRHRLKINAILNNAQQVLRLAEREGSLSHFLWSFVDDKPLTQSREARAFSPESSRMSKGLKTEGFKFLGQTTCYSFMQAVGMVNDHSPECFRYHYLS